MNTKVACEVVAGKDGLDKLLFDYVSQREVKCRQSCIMKPCQLPRATSLGCIGLHLPDSSALFATNTSLMEVRNKTPRVDHLERKMMQSSD